MTRRTRLLLLSGTFFLGAIPAGVGGQPASKPGTVVDDFEETSGWSAHPADGVELTIGSAKSPNGRALELGFYFRGGGGYAVARREVDLDLPENYTFAFEIRGEAPVNHLEFKLIDSSGENVWWSVRRDVEFPRSWETYRIKKRHISFAWGPRGGGEIEHVAAIEFAITAGTGGSGTVWIDDLRLVPLPPPTETPPEPVVLASSFGAESPAGHAGDGDWATFWSPEPGDTDPWIALDFGGVREFGGLSLAWARDRAAANYTVEVSDDGDTWRSVREVTGSNGGRDHLFLPESESRFLRVRAPSSSGIGMVELVVRPLSWSASREAFFGALAAETPRGTYPRGIHGEQAFWTVTGVDGDPREVLLGEDGNLETAKGGFSIEPFLFTGGRLVTWADAVSDQVLSEGYLPAPTVLWRVDHLGMELIVVPVGEPGASSVFARYRVFNRGAVTSRAVLYLALRPFQVNPPSQTLNTIGGFAPIESIDRDGRVIRVNGQNRVICLTEPADFGATSFDGGDIVADYLRENEVPAKSRVEDPFAGASGALRFPLELEPGEMQEIQILVPLYGKSPLPDLEDDSRTRMWVEEQTEQSLGTWRERTGGITFEIPPSGRLLLETLRAQIGYILVNRAGPAIQPGSRSYARSWIRDGALTSSALLRFGLEEPVREFIEWFAPHQYDNGKVPCVVDHRGADPVPEHDSSGEFIYLIAEYYRFTRDRAFLDSHWPRVLRAVSYLDSLRQERRTPEYRDPERAHFFGILPPSISHEGYSAKPMHSYWDDLFALRGFKDAVFLAGELSLPEEQARLQFIRDEFATDLSRSTQTAMRRHDIDYIPGCADLGDFDPTSTTIALNPVGATDVLGKDNLLQTFERYWRFFEDRRSGADWTAFTPYEIRNVGAFVRLGWRERAAELLSFFFSHQRPAGWRQWAEVVRREDRIPGFLGDLPHTWVGSDFVRSALDLFAYERESDLTLVIGAGLPGSWLAEPGVTVRGLRTYYGPLEYEMVRRDGSTSVRIESGLDVPPGGIVVKPPLEKFGEVTVNGDRVRTGPGGEVIVRTLPATVLYER